MSIERELRELCEEFINLLYESEEKNVISEKELKICLTEKTKFLNSYVKKLELQ